MLRSVPEPVSTNLPIERTNFIGRAQDVADVHALVAAYRLVTLIGAGGAGKTRLATQVGFDLLQSRRDGVWMVDLGPVSDPKLVAQRMASILGIPEEHGLPIRASIAQACADKEMLLVLDNCEHLIEACAVLADRVLASAPAVGILATSRQALGLEEERIWAVPQLSIPHTEAEVTSQNALDFDAIALFVDRATMADPTYRLDPDDLPYILQICRHLDGLPLAIELAAARTSILSPRQIAERIGDRFRLLTRGARTAPDRQQTLRSAIGWSYDLLNPSERRLFRALAVFPGTFTLEAAEEVCSTEALSKEEILELLDQLVGKSLVGTRRGGDRVRYLLNETTRAYAQEMLAEAGEDRAMRDHQRDWGLALVDEAKSHLSAPEQARWLDILELEIDNLRAAFDWSLATRPEVALPLAAGLLRFWMVRGSWSEGQRRLQASLDAAPDADPVARLVALDAAAVLADLVSEYDLAQSFHEQHLTVARSIGDRQAVGEALRGIAWTLLRRGDVTNARPVAQEAVDVWREVGDKRGLSDALITLAFATHDMAGARALGEQALALTRELGDQEAIAGMEMRVGGFAMLQGDYQASQKACERSLALARELGYKRYIARGLHSLGDIALSQGDLAGARGFLEDALGIWPEVGHRNAIAQAYYALGEVARLEGDATAAETLLEETLARCRALEMHEDAAWVLTRLAELARGQDDVESAESLYREALHSGARLASWFVVVHAIEGLGGIAAAAGNSASGARLLGAAEALRETLSTPIPPVYRAAHEADVAAARRSLDADRFAALWAEGRATRLEDVLISQGATSTDAAPKTPPARARTASALFRLDGEYFTLAFQGPAFRLRDSKGLRHIARLLGEPDREFHALDLASQGERSPASRADDALSRVSGTGDSGEILDHQARDSYRRRLEDLRDELQQAEDWGDAERGAKAREEIEFLSRELAAGVGLGGRPRHVSNDAERARVNVTRAVRSAIEKIEAQSPELARYLSGTIRTGMFCSFIPDPRFPTSWVL